MAKAQALRPGEVLGVGFEEPESFLLAGREGFGALLADGEHGRVDIGDGHAHRGVFIEDMGVVKHAKCDVTGSAGDVEDMLRATGGRVVG